MVTPSTCVNVVVVVVVVVVVKVYILEIMTWISKKLDYVFLHRRSTYHS